MPPCLSALTLIKINRDLCTKLVSEENKDGEILYATASTKDEVIVHASR